MVCRRRHARVWPHRALARQPGHAPDGAERPGGPGGGFHAVELSHQPGGAQDGCRAGHRLFHDRQGARRNARRAGRADPRFRRRGPAARRAGPGLWQPGRHLQLPDCAPRHPQGHLHRLHAGGQTACRSGRPAHEARDHGTGRARAGDRGRRRRRGAGRESRWRSQVSQRGAGVHFAHAFPGAREHCQGVFGRAGETRRRSRCGQRQHRGHADGSAGQPAPCNGHGRVHARRTGQGRHAGHRRRAHRQ